MSGPAFATGVMPVPGTTEMVSVLAAEIFSPSLTMRENTKTAAEPGALKLGRMAVAAVSVTAGPEVCVHA